MAMGSEFQKEQVGLMVRIDVEKVGRHNIIDLSNLARWIHCTGQGELAIRWAFFEKPGSAHHVAWQGFDGSQPSRLAHDF